MLTTYIYAQNTAGERNDLGQRQRRLKENGRFQEPEKVTVDGALALKNGLISVESGGITYHVPMLGRYAGFLDGLKENVKVKLEGYSVKRLGESAAFLHPVKMTLGGKEYDFPDRANFDGRGRGNFDGYGRRNHYGPRSGPGFGRMGGGWGGGGRGGCW
jgi:hypothetical protein